MKLLPLGVGSGFTQRYFHSNLLVDLSGRRLLLDAGTTLRYSLDQAQIRPETIDYIFITHFHHDHVGGLAELLFVCHWHFKNGEHRPHRPILLCRQNQINDLDKLLSPSLNNQGKVWQDYCTPLVVDGTFVLTDGTFLEIIPTDNLHCEGLNSCGVKLILESGNNVIMTGDIKNLADSPILSFVDSRTTAIIQETSFQPNDVHSTYKEVLAYYPKHLHEKIYGIHYEDDVELDKEYLIKLLRQGVALDFC